MMIHLLTYLNKNNFNSVLIKGSRSLTISDEVWQKIKQGDTNLVLDLLTKCFSPEDPVHEDSIGFNDSNSYGPNPWSSLLWFGECLLFDYHENHKSLENGKNQNIIKLWFSIVSNKFYKTFIERRRAIVEKLSGIGGMRAAHCFKIMDRFSKLYIDTDKKFKNDWNADFIKYRSNIKDELRTVFLNRINQHITSFEISDGMFDPGELTFSMEGLTLLDDYNHYIQDVLLKKFFDIMNQTLSYDVYWKPIKPIKNRDQGSILLPISAEVGNSLLRICSNMSNDPQNLNWFLKYKSMFKSFAKWVTKQVVMVNVKTDDKQKQYYGWHSEHIMEPLHNSRFIHLWATREYYIYLMQYRAFRSQEIMWELIQKNDFNVDWNIAPPKWYLKEDKKDKENESSIVEKWSEEEPPDPKDYWKSTVIPAYEGIQDDNLKDLKVYKKIEEEFIDRPKSDKWSMLLYGPPGTGKTTIAENIAKALRWPLITITPSDFIRNGGGMVEARAKQIFRSLRRMKDMVVLFDEIDRLILDRDAPMYFKQDDTFQFMTPSMLVKIRDLWKSKRVIFIVCTNYEERIDPAAKRKGRIDKPILVMPPDLQKRLGIMLCNILLNEKEINDIWKDDKNKKERLSIIISYFVSFIDPDLIKEAFSGIKDIKQKTFGLSYENINDLALEFKLEKNEELIGKLKSAINNFSSFHFKDLKIDNFKIKWTNESDQEISPNTIFQSYKHRFSEIQKVEANVQDPFNEFFKLFKILCHENDDDIENVNNYFSITGQKEIRKEIFEKYSFDEFERYIDEIKIHEDIKSYFKKRHRSEDMANKKVSQ